MAIKGLDKHLRRLRRLAGEEMVRVAGQVAYEGADAIKAKAQNLITTGSVSGASHTPSSPGQAPNNDTGFLAGAIIAIEAGPLSAEVGALAPYSTALEFGTSKMAARPFMRPARDQMRPEIEARFKRQMDQFVKRSGR